MSQKAARLDSLYSQVHQYGEFNGNVLVAQKENGVTKLICERDTVRTFEQISGQPLNYRICDRQPGDIVSIYADVTKLQTGLNWTAQNTLREILVDAWRWQQRLHRRSE